MGRTEHWGEEALNPEGGDDNMQCASVSPSGRKRRDKKSLIDCNTLEVGGKKLAPRSKISTHINLELVYLFKRLFSINNK